jgi:hypothetical protein
MMTPSNTPNDREVLVCCEGANAAISLIGTLGAMRWVLYGGVALLCCLGGPAEMELGKGREEEERDNTIQYNTT